jgi:hypothetical protein
VEHVRIVQTDERPLGVQCWGQSLLVPQAIGLLHPDGPAAAAADEAKEAAEAQRAAEVAAQLKNPARVPRLAVRHSSGAGLDGLTGTPRLSSTPRHQHGLALASQPNGGADLDSGTDAEDFQVITLR